MSVENKVSYLKGLAEGLQLDESTKEGKLLLAIIDVLDEIAFEMDEYDEELVQLGEYVEELDTDLLEVEEYLYDDDDCDCGCCDVDGMSQTECPNCHETIYFDDELLDSDDELCCPDCGANLFPEEE